MQRRKITYNDYIGKVLGGWPAKSIGGTVGAPFESHKIFGEMTAENCWPKKIYPNDDLDIQVVWLEMLEEVGPGFQRSDLVRYWQDRCRYNFAEYGFFCTTNKEAYTLLYREGLTISFLENLKDVR